MRIMGIDIGTTTISMVVTESDSRKLIASQTIKNQFFLKGKNAEEQMQDPDSIWNIVKEKFQEMTGRYGKPDGIGLTGQMHGMLYVDEQGNAVSPLYTWQDKRGERIVSEQKSSVDLLRESAGASAAGYGLATHFYLQKTGGIPQNGVKMTTISDYIGMKLCGLESPVIGPDMAASWGCFDLVQKEFNVAGLKQLGVDLSYLPEVRKKHFILGETRENIPVMGSIGDNQASFFGSVESLSDTVLLNVGTGSQVSFVSSGFVSCEGSLELRPCTSDSYLLVGASLCGGRAYAVLEQFYREISGQKENCYQQMETQAREFIRDYGKESAWKICTAFSGSRNNPGEKGTISNIGIENFHPGAMTIGVIEGILDELYQDYKKMCCLTGKKAARMTGSGNGIRKNSLMRELAEEMFGMRMEIPDIREEAACGAAVCMGSLLRQNGKTVRY